MKTISLILIIGIVFLLLVVGCAKSNVQPSQSGPYVGGGCGVEGPEDSNKKLINPLYMELKL